MSLSDAERGRWARAEVDRLIAPKRDKDGGARMDINIRVMGADGRQQGWTTVPGTVYGVWAAHETENYAGGKIPGLSITAGPFMGYLIAVRHTMPIAKALAKELGAHKKLTRYIMAGTFTEHIEEVLHIFNKHRGPSDMVAKYKNHNHQQEMKRIEKERQQREARQREQEAKWAEQRQQQQRDRVR